MNAGEIMVGIAQDADYDETVDEIRDASKNVEGAKVKVSKYLDDRVSTIGALVSGQNSVEGNGMDVFFGTDKPLKVRVFGQEQEALETEAAKIAKIVDSVEGVSNATVQKPEQQPTLEIEVDLEKARESGVKPGDARRAEAIIVQGILVGSVFEDQKVFDVVVQGNPDIAKDPEAVRNLLIDRPDGGHVRLSEIADIREGTSPTVIQRDEVSRRLDITMDVSGRSVADVSEEVEEKLQDVDMPLEYHAKVIDDTLADEISRGRFLAFGLAAALAVLLLMQAAVRSWRLAGLAYLTLPSALLGGILALLLTGDGLTIATGGGLLAVFVLAVRNTLDDPRSGRTCRRVRGRAGALHPGRDEQSRDRGRHAAVRDPRVGRRAGDPAAHGDRGPGRSRHDGAARTDRAASPQCVRARSRTGPGRGDPRAGHHVRHDGGFAMSASSLALDRKVAAALVAAFVAVAPAACKQAEAIEQEHYQASKISEGEDGHPVVTLTKLGASSRSDLRRSRSRTTASPYASVLYDAAGGQPYVFVNPEGLNFHREDVDIERIDGDVVHLSKGPESGTRVVTVGVPQIHGAELEFGAY